MELEEIVEHRYVNIRGKNTPGMGSGDADKIEFVPRPGPSGVQFQRLNNRKDVPKSGSAARRDFHGRVHSAPKLEIRKTGMYDDASISRCPEMRAEPSPAESFIARHPKMVRAFPWICVGSILGGIVLVLLGISGFFT